MSGLWLKLGEKIRKYCWKLEAGKRSSSRIAVNAKNFRTSYEGDWACGAIDCGGEKSGNELMDVASGRSDHIGERCPRRAIREARYLHGLLFKGPTSFLESRSVLHRTAAFDFMGIYEPGSWGWDWLSAEQVAAPGFRSRASGFLRFRKQAASGIARRGTKGEASECDRVNIVVSYGSYGIQEPEKNDN